MSDITKLNFIIIDRSEMLSAIRITHREVSCIYELWNDIETFFFFSTLLKPLAGFLESWWYGRSWRGCTASLWTISVLGWYFFLSNISLYV